MSVLCKVTAAVQSLGLKQKALLLTVQRLSFLDVWISEYPDSHLGNKDKNVLRASSETGLEYADSTKVT